MRSFTYILGALVLLLLVLNIVILIKHKENKEESQLLFEQYNEVSAKGIMLKQQGAFQQAAEAVVLPDMELKSPKDNSRIKLSSLLKDGHPKLFFRFRETDCDACVQHSLDLIKEAANRIPGEDIIILSGYKNVRQFYAYTKTQKLSTYNIEDQSLPLDTQEQPYFFIIADHARIQNVFVPLKGDKGYTADYLSMMKNKYWHLHQHHSH
jgi:hypothetical protein